MPTFIVLLTYTSSGNRCGHGLRLWEHVRRTIYKALYETFFLLEKENFQKKCEALVL
jgi:hypothetical protein